MTREKAKEFISKVLTGHHEICTHNHYADMVKAIDKIYDSFEDEKQKTIPFLTMIENQHMVERIAELESQNKSLTDMVEMQSEKISRLEAPKTCKSCLFYVTRYNIHGDEAYKYCTAEINKASDTFLCNKHKDNQWIK